MDFRPPWGVLQRHFRKPLRTGLTCVVPRGNTNYLLQVASITALGKRDKLPLRFDANPGLLSDWVLRELNTAGDAVYMLEIGRAHV